jgi:16S rRNA processing protein RimM
MRDYLKIGKISSAHGIKGTVKIIPLTDDITRFYNLKYVYLCDNAASQKLAIQNVQLGKNIVFMKFNEINSRSEAESLKNTFLYVDRVHAVPLEDDEYFIEDLIGLSAYDLNNVNLGEISDIIQTGGVDVIVISGKKKYLIPALKKNVSVFIDQGMIKVDTSSGVDYD